MNAIFEHRKSALVCSTLLALFLMGCSSTGKSSGLGAGIRAVVGGAAGYMIAGEQGALIGAGAGALVGAGTGYAIGK